MTAADDLRARLAPVTLVVGKGGVGKTTVAAALARDAAARRERTLVVTTDPAATLLAALGLPLERTARPRAIADSLDAWALDAGRIRDEFLAAAREPIATILDRGTYLDRADIDGLVDAALPGADEIFAVLALGDVLSADGADRYERIVIDTAPTGHTLRLLSLPDSFASLVTLLDAMLEKHRFMVRALTHRYRTDATDEFLEWLRARVDSLRSQLTTPTRTAALLVVRPEPVVIAESARYLGALETARIRVAAVLVNLWRGTPDDRAALAPLDGAVPTFTAPPLDGDPVDALLARVSSRAQRASPDLAATPSGESHAATGAAVELADLVRSLTVVVGKGGVGKTTAACALAMAASERGETLLVSTDPAPSVGDALDLTIGDDDVAVPGVARLAARQMDATAAFAAFRTRYQDRIDAVFDGMTGGGMEMSHDRRVLRDLLALAPPGIDELYALTVLGDTLEEGRYAFIVVDPAPTGHLLRLLDMPALAVSWGHELMRLMLKYKDVVGLGDAAGDLLAFVKRTKALDARLRDARLAGAVLVALDEPLVRGESRRLRAALAERHVALAGVVWNRVDGGVAPLEEVASAAQIVAPRSVEPPIGAKRIRAWSRQWKRLT